MIKKILAVAAVAAVVVAPWLLSLASPTPTVVAVCMLLLAMVLWVVVASLLASTCTTSPFEPSTS